MDEHVKGRTYDFLRLSLVVVLLAIVASVFVEWRSANWCLQTSISAYYFTPVRAIFVSGLVALGVGMIVIHGRDALEDASLNLAGMFAPVVAFVPTVDANHCSLAAGVVTPDEEGQNPTAAETVATASPAVDNNMSTFLGVVGLVLIFMLVLRLVAAKWGSRDAHSGSGGGAGQETAAYILTYVVAVIAWGIGFYYFTRERETFDNKAHGVSAVLLCICVIVVVFAGARSRARRGIGDEEWSRKRSWEKFKKVMTDRYGWLWMLIIVTTLGILLFHGLVGWEHWILAAEVNLLILFAVFWVVQTLELWSGLRLNRSKTRTPSTGEKSVQSRSGVT